MNDIITEQSNGILRIKFNRPEKKNAMTSAMYVALLCVLCVSVVISPALVRPIALS